MVAISDARDRTRPANGTVPATGAKAARLRCVFLLVYAGLVVARLPKVFARGRFWAEEGAVYFFHAWHDPWPDALVWVHTGYLNLTASVAAVLARFLVPLPDAPLVTSAVGLAMQLLPPALLCVSGIAWLRHPAALGCAMLLLLAPPFQEEVWLNSITSQFHLTLSVAIILASDRRGGVVGWLRCAVLAWTPLSSPGAVALAPLFVLRAFVERSRTRALQAGLMLAGGAVQALVLLSHPEAARDHGLGPVALLAVFAIKNVITPLLGKTIALAQGQALHAAFSAGEWAVVPASIGLVAIVGLAVAVWRVGDRAVVWMFLAALMVAAVSYEAALTVGHPLEMAEAGFGTRYAYVPNALLGLVLLGLASRARRTGRLVGAALCAAILLTGAAWYFDVAPDMADGPAWRDEIRTLAATPNRAIQLWPSWFTMYLIPTPPG